MKDSKVLTPRDKKKLAWCATHKAIRKGMLVRPRICEICGEEFPLKGKNKLQAHHYFGYEEKHWLDIQWLCDKCHKAEHKKVRDKKFGRA